MFIRSLINRIGNEATDKLVVDLLLMLSHDVQYLLIFEGEEEERDRLK